MPEPATASSPAPAVPATPEEIERHWFETVYAGDGVPQLTLRAVLMGMLVGIALAFSNIYVGLKAGWSLNVAITASIVSFAVFKLVPLDWLQAPRRLVLFDRHGERKVTILEVNCLQSTASASGYSTGPTLVSAFSAYLLVTGAKVPFGITLALVLLLGLLGVFLAIPMKRSMVNVEKLPFPSGIAAAETLRSLFAHGQEAARKARALFTGMGAGALVAWFRDGKPALIPNFAPLSALFEKLGLTHLARLTSPQGYTLSLDLSLLLVGGGAIMGLRTAGSMVLGAILNYGVIAPWLHGKGIITRLGFRGIVSWSVWCGVAVMTSAALFSFFWNWRTIARAFTGLGRRAAADDPLARIEVPGSWFALGVLLAGMGAMLVNRVAFEIPAAMTLLAILLSALMAVVAARATGETDTTPIGPVGKITQLAYGVLMPQNITANLMTANITSSMAIGSADLLTDLKSGYLLGANPRKQFLAQFFGVFSGALAATGAFFVLVPDPSALGGDRFPAPAALVWKAVAELLARGLESLPPYALASLWIGALAGVGLTLLEKLVPRSRRFLPSPVGLGMAFTFQGWSSISFFLGAAAAWAWEKRSPKLAALFVIPVASGVIAGESLTGVAVAVLNVLGVL
ncbi:MAG TPA: OPT family oligopeptide transporter [Anaeromyxobacteraceae bacterium]|jgi:putative OPT family oligopeptide transporter